MKQPLQTDEIIAIILLGIAFLIHGSSFFDDLRWWLVLYLLICIAMRKYEAILQKYSGSKKL